MYSMSRKLTIYFPDFLLDSSVPHLTSCSVWLAECVILRPSCSVLTPLDSAAIPHGFSELLTDG